MAIKTFEKQLTANDTGESGAHQAGIHVPKSQTELIAFLPPLDASVKNPDAWIACRDEEGVTWNFRYIHYNNSLHDSGGTRDEYRITHMTAFFRAVGAKARDIFRISGEKGAPFYRIAVLPASKKRGSSAGDSSPQRIRLRGWRQVH